MLSHIDIRNFTIIPTLSIEFESGMTVLTGETGAGKSIILNALSLALGARAKKNLVRDPKSAAEITLSFHIDESSLAAHWLQQHNLAEDNECIIRRIIDKDGKSKSSINGRPCPLSTTRELAEHLIHIHSQHQQQQLLKPAWQGECLDHFAEHKKLLDAVRMQHDVWHSLQTQIDEAESNNQDHSHEIALIEYQLNELQELAPLDGEWQQLSDQYDCLAQAQGINDTVAQCLLNCRDQEDTNAEQLLQQSLERLQQLKINNPHLKNATDLLHNAIIHCQEAYDEIHHFANSVESDDESLTKLNNRLEKLDQVARKHQISPKALPQQLITLEEKLHTLTHLDEHLAELKQLQADCFTQYQAAAKKLTQSRQKAAKKLANTITEDIKTLNMPGSRFHIALKERNQQPHPLGAESLAFQLSTQPKQPLQSLADIASGGELSRITLALMLATAPSTQMPVFIFDEIDVGMGGQTAKLVGQLIQSLSAQSQVFCITHLPQVAALGHHHLRVNKALDDSVVTSTITALDKQQRIEELARMTSGDQLTEAALAHASTLVEA